MSMAIMHPAMVKDAEGIAYVHGMAWQRTYRGWMRNSVLKTLSVGRRARQWKEMLQDNAKQTCIIQPLPLKLIGRLLASQIMAGSAKVTRSMKASYLPFMC